MKINQKLLQRLDQSIGESFIQRLAEEKAKRAEPEQFINKDGNFRVRVVTEEKQDALKKSKCDAMSTATSNFFKDQDTTISTKHTPSLTASKLLDSSKVSSLRQSINTSRIVSAQPTRPLLIKRSLKQPSETEKKEEPQNQDAMKEQIPPIQKPLFQLKRLQSQKPCEDSPLQLAQGVTESISSKPPLARRLSSHAKKMESSTVYSQAAPMQQLKKKISQEPEKVYEVMDTDTLREITGVGEEEFYSVQKVSFKFNTTNDSLYQLGEMLPGLLELKLNQSQIESLRLLGTRLRNLRVLWMNNSKLVDISGISSMPQLQEFYCSFNSIKDLSALVFHENLSIIDIEANEVADEMQIDYLETLPNLQQLIISSNPIAKNDRLVAVLYEKLKANIVIINEDYAASQIMLQQDEDSSSQIQQLYEIAQQIDSNLNLQNVDQMRMLESQLRCQLDQQQEPDEDSILTMSIKRKTLQKPKLQRPQTACDPKSELTYTSEIFAGNPIKAAKQSKKLRESDKYDIQSLLDQFK